MSDPIANMLTSIRNAQKVGKDTVKVHYSKINQAIADVLKDEGYIQAVELLKDGNKNDLLLTLKYYMDAPVIKRIDRVSKPGCRVYSSSDDLPVKIGSFGIAIVSTPKGVMASKSARAANLGGEVLCIVE